MRRKIFYTLFFLLFSTPLVLPQKCSYPMEPVDPIHLDSRRELFVDHFLIDHWQNMRLVMHEPVDKGIVLKFDNPWEGPFCGYCTVIKTDEKYQLYYRGMPDVGKDDNQIVTTCYAESSDGIHWRKPDLGLFEVNGTMKNNVVLANAGAVNHNFSPFLDARPGVPREQRYKALGGTEKSGLIAYVSPDGIHWSKLREKAVFTRGKFDSQNVSFWSVAEKCYVCYFRTWTGTGYSGFRTVSRTTSADFIHWTDPVEMDFGDTPQENIYINQTHPYFRAPHIYLAIAARFMPGRQVLTEEQAKQLDVNPKYFKDCSDVVLMSSRGGNRYERTFMSAFIRPGIGLQNWVSRSNYPALNVVQTGPYEMSIYLNQNYAQPTSHLHRYSLRLDGFISAYAPYKGGELVTKPFIFTGGRMSLNFATSAAGEIRVEIQDEIGNPFAGYHLEDANTIIGNEIDRVVSWKNGANVTNLAGKTVRLRFVMKDAHLYSFRFK